MVLVLPGLLGLRDWFPFVHDPHNPKKDLMGTESTLLDQEQE